MDGSDIARLEQRVRRNERRWSAVTIMFVLLLSVGGITIVLLTSRQGEELQDKTMVCDALENLEQGHFEEAREAAVHVLRKDPDNIVALRASAAALGQLDQAEESRGQLERIIELRPDDIGARRALAQMNYQNQDYEATARRLGEIAEIRPEFLDRLPSNTPEKVMLRDERVAAYLSRTTRRPEGLDARSEAAFERAREEIMGLAGNNDSAGAVRAYEKVVERHPELRERFARDPKLRRVLSKRP